MNGVGLLSRRIFSEIRKSPWSRVVRNFQARPFTGLQHASHHHLINFPTDVGTACARSSFEHMPPIQAWHRLYPKRFCTGGDFTKVVVPSMGESVSDGSIAALLKEAGDVLEVDEVIAQIETDKVTIDVRTPDSGVLEKYEVKEGDTVTPGTMVAIVKRGNPTQMRATASSKEVSKAPPVKEQETSSAPDKVSGSSNQVTPPPSVKASSSPPGTPSSSLPSQSSNERERRVPMTRLRKRVATRLKDAQNTFALLTTFNEIDMTNLMKLRSDFKDLFLEKHGVKLGFMSAFVKAAVSALKQEPTVNGVIDGDDIIYRDYVDISIAVGTPKGLVVPVIRNADNMGFADVEKTINALGKKARDGTISIDDMAGGTFTISNGGVYGSLISTPIINPPQSAILGMHSIQQRPMVVGKDIVARPMMYVALTYDHRLIDGREAVVFLKRIKDVVEDPRRLLLDI